ncbi:MAG TPA: hypothetical protein VH062_02730 [Polyangiaceae bacterium]|jgi:hypothetical protein|nr:hypothetical protein [Polyangiaceae bacterium]
MMRWARAQLACAVTIASVACAPARAPDRANAVAPLPPAELTSYVPAAGLRWLAVARLAELSHAPEMKKSLELLFPATRLDAFAKSTGLDLRTSPLAAAAGFDLATLFLAETPWENALIERQFTERLTLAPTVSVSARGVRRIAGTVGLNPETLLRADRRFVAVAIGDPTPARVAELYAEQRLPRSPPALKGSALSTLPATLAAAPIRFYAPGPFAGEWASGARGLLGVTVALGVGVYPEGDALRVVAVLSGRWNGTDVDQLEAAWNDLAQSSMGRLLGLDQPLTPADVTVTSDQLTLEVHLARLPLVTGLRAAVAADVWEFLKAPTSEKKAPAELPTPP